MASADSIANGLAESQTMKKTDWNEYENPARAWIDLVAAFKSGKPEQVRACLEQAKVSHWTHGDFDRSLEEMEEEGSDTEEYDSDEDFPAGVGHVEDGWDSDFVEE